MREPSRGGAPRRSRAWSALLGLACLSVVLSGCSSTADGSGRSGTTGARPRPRVLLIVGDSVAVQAADALVRLAPPGKVVTVDAVMAGSAPCDWNHGFIDPATKQPLSFASILHNDEPDAVAFVFTGNPGLSGPPAGCVDADRDYSLSELLATYQSALTTMADEAVARGAQVFFEAPPPRNPAVPTGWDPAEDGNHGFQGIRAIATFYKDLAAQEPGRWFYDESAGSAVSTPDLVWRLTLPCQAWDAERCMSGQVQVRDGGTDAVHLDVPGCGAVRLALALEEHVFGTPAPDPQVVASKVATYGGCK